MNEGIATIIIYIYYDFTIAGQDRVNTLGIEKILTVGFQSGANKIPGSNSGIN